PGQLLSSGVLRPLNLHAFELLDRHRSDEIAARQIQRLLGHAQFDYDVTLFEEYIEEAEALRGGRRPTEVPGLNGGRLRACLEGPVALYQAAFLEGLAEPWVIARRARLRERYVGALVGLGDRLFHEGHYPQAASAFREALQRAPDQQSAHRGLALLAVRQGD